MDALSMHSSPHICMACHSSVKGISFDAIKEKYGATYFCNAPTYYVVTVNYPDLTCLQVEDKWALVYFLFKSVPVYNKVKLLIKDPDRLAIPGKGVCSVIHVCATCQKKGEDVVGGCFNTVFICNYHDGVSGSIPSMYFADQWVFIMLIELLGFMVVCIHVVFKIPKQGMLHLFLSIVPKK